MENNISKELLEAIDSYIRGELRGSKLSDLENQLEKNEVLKDEYLLQLQLFRSQDQQSTDWTILKDDVDNLDQQAYKKELNKKEYQNLSDKIRRVGQEFSKPQEKVKPYANRNRRYFIILGIILLVLSLLLLKTLESDKIDSTYFQYANWEKELPSFIEKGNAQGNFEIGEKLFKNEQYLEAIKVFKLIDNEESLYPYSLMFLGAANEKLNNYEEAISYFNLVYKMNSFTENSKGLWYQALIYSKIEDQENFVLTLELITQNEEHYNFKIASELLISIKQ